MSTENIELDVELHVDEKLRVVTAAGFVSVGGKIYRDTAGSRCSGNDVFDRDLGEALATARVVASLGKQIERDMRRRVARNDAIRERNEREAKKRLKAKNKRSKKIKRELGITV